MKNRRENTAFLWEELFSQRKGFESWSAMPDAGHNVGAGEARLQVEAA